MENKVRLIDANALEKDMRAYADNKAYCGHIELANGICKAVGRIDLAPTIDPESPKPQEHCDWCKPEHELCGTCIKKLDYYGDGGSDVCSDALGQPKCHYYKPMNYCPNCGAKMEG